MRGHSGMPRVQRAHERGAVLLRQRLEDALFDGTWRPLTAIAESLGCSVHSLDYAVRVLERSGRIVVAFGDSGKQGGTVRIVRRA